MWSNLFILHSNKQNRFEEHHIDDTLFHFKTCLRSIYIGDKRISKISPLDEYELILGYKAYKLILEIVCGMHSKLFGETEIMSQFKVQLDDKNLFETPFGSYLKKLKNHIMEDAKIIRSKYLQNRGEQSYGGLARKYTKDINSVTILGTGQLALKILPWVSNKKVTVIGRDRNKLDSILEKFKVKKILTFEQIRNYTDEAFIIVAPIFFEIENYNTTSLILDFRDKTFDEKYPNFIRYVSLEDMFLQLSKLQNENNKLKKRILEEMDSIIYSRRMKLQMSVNCWEDMF